MRTSLGVLGPLGWSGKQKQQTACMRRPLAGAIAFIIVSGPASVTLPARADTITGTAVTNVLFGIDNIVTIETGYGFYSEPSLVLTSDVATAAGQSFAAQLAADPAALTGVAPIYINPITGEIEYSVPIGQPIPTYVLNAISDSTGANVLGLNAGVNGAVISPDPAISAFDAMVGFNPSFVPVDLDYSFEYSFTTTLTDGPYEGDQLNLLDNFQFYQATPIPAALPLFASGVAGLALFGWRRKRKVEAVAA
jgi:hypothetical protein